MDRPLPPALKTGAVVGGAFGVLRARPVAVAIWGLVYAAALAAFSLSVRAGLRVAPQGEGNPAALAASGINLLVNIVFLILFMTLLTAAMRSVLTPTRRGFAFLLFGVDELRQVGLALFFLILFYVGLIILGVVVAVATALFIAATGTGTAMIVALGVGGVALLALASWLAVRLSLSFPLTLLRGAITISESWRLTRGRFWPLFWAYLLLYLLMMVVALGVASVTLGDYLATLARDGLTLQALQAAASAQLARQLGPIDAMMILGWILGGFAGALGVALEGGALATAALTLADVRAEMAETFA